MLDGSGFGLGAVRVWRPTVTCLLVDQRHGQCKLKDLRTLLLLLLLLLSSGSQDTGNRCPRLQHDRRVVENGSPGDVRHDGVIPQAERPVLRPQLAVVQGKVVDVHFIDGELQTTPHTG